jgi:hypothetical protein
MAPPPKNKTFAIKYIKNDGFKTTQVHGVYGGMNVRGQLNIVFYVDTVDYPKTNFVPIIGKTLGKEVLTLEQAAVRELHFGINVDIPLAKEIIKWMSDHVTAYEALTQTEEKK